MEPEFVTYGRDHEPWILQSLQPMWCESFQRWAAQDAIRAVYERNRVAAPEARHLLVLSDCDEILLADMLVWLRTKENVGYLDAHGGFAHFFMDFYYYSLRWRKESRWDSAAVTTAEYFIGASVMDIRRLRDMPSFNVQTLMLTNAGAHLSYFMSADDIARKVNGFAHQVRTSTHACACTARVLTVGAVVTQELNQERYKSREWIAKCIEEGIDLFNRTGSDALHASGISTEAECFLAPSADGFARMAVQMVTLLNS
jgi:hypothetical protein